MPTFLRDLIDHFRLADLLDILVVSVLIYFGLQWLRARASRPVAVGVLLLAAIYMVAGAVGMTLTSWLFQTGATAILLTLVLIFHEDIRRFIERLGVWRRLSGRTDSDLTSNTIDVLVESLTDMAEKHIGALVVLPGREAIHRHLRGGVEVDGLVSAALLHSIFQPRSATHDGAVILDGNRIERVGVHLPLTENTQAVGRTGTRHAAAVGMAERTDALVLVVSEERGTISIAEGSRLERATSAAALRQRLEQFHHRIAPPQRPSLWQRLPRHPGLKLAALLLGVLLWMIFVYRPFTSGRPISEVVQQSFTLQVEYVGLGPDLMLVEPAQPAVQIGMRGPSRGFARFRPEDLSVRVDLSNHGPGRHQVPLSEQQVNQPEGLQVLWIEPQVLTVELAEMVRRTLPVEVTLHGELPAGLALRLVRAEPAQVELLMARTTAEAVTAVATEPLDLSRLDQADSTHTLALVLPPQARLPEGTGPTVQVTVQVRAETTGAEDGAASEAEAMGTHSQPPGR